MAARTLLLSLALATALVGVSTTAQAAPAKSKKKKKSEASLHFDAAAELYAQADYEGAAREFSIAYALEPRVDTLFAWAQAERLAEHDEAALELYDRLLADELSDTQREAIEGLRTEVQAEIAVAEAERAAALAAEQAELRDKAPDEPATTGPRPGVLATGVGAALSLLGGGLLIGAAAADSRVRRAQTYPEFEAAYDPRTGRGRGALPLYVTGSMLAAAGLATLIVGVVRLARAKRPRAARERGLAIMPVFGREQQGFVLTIGSWR